LSVNLFIVHKLEKKIPNMVKNRLHKVVTWSMQTNYTTLWAASSKGDAERES